VADPTPTTTGTLIQRAMDVLRQHSKPAGIALLATAGLPALTGCVPPASVTDAVEAEQPARDAPMGTELAEQILFDAPTTQQIADARSALEAAGVASSQLATIAEPTDAIRIAQLYDAWSGRYDVGQLNRGDFHVFAALAARGDTDVNELVELIDSLPTGFLRRPSELLAMYGAVDSTAIDRARALRTEFGYSPLTRDLDNLGTMSTDELDGLQAFLTKLRDAGGLAFTRFVQPGFLESHSDLDRVLEVLPVSSGGTAKVSLNRAIFDPEGGAIEVDEAKLLAGVSKLHGHGVTFTPLHLSAAAVLGGGTPAQQARLDALLARSSAPSHVRSSSELARLALRPLHETLSDDAILGQLDVARSRLGRTLDANEISAVVSGAKRGTSIDDMVPKAAGAFVKSSGAFTYVKDAYTIANLPPSALNTSRAALSASLEAAIVPGAHRTDSNADYHEVFAPQTRAMSTGEHHKITLVRQALDSPAFRAQLAAAVDADLADPTAEAGGLIRFAANGELEAVRIDSDGDSDTSYLLPAEVEPLQAVVTFHVHGGGAEAGAPALAGPSSAHGGTSGDRGDAWSIHQDDIVITRLSKTTFNVDFYNGTGVVVDLGDFALLPALALTP